jgi:hypothetical protein
VGVTANGSADSRSCTQPSWATERRREGRRAYEDHRPEPPESKGKVRKASGPRGANSAPHDLGLTVLRSPALTCVCRSRSMTRPAHLANTEVSRLPGGTRAAGPGSARVSLRRPHLGPRVCATRFRPTFWGIRSNSVPRARFHHEVELPRQSYGCRGLSCSVTVPS